MAQHKFFLKEGSWVGQGYICNQQGTQTPLASYSQIAHSNNTCHFKQLFKNLESQQETIRELTIENLKSRHYQDLNWRAQYSDLGPSQGSFSLQDKLVLIEHVFTDKSLKGYESLQKISDIQYTQQASFYKDGLLLSHLKLLLNLESH